MSAYGAHPWPGRTRYQAWQQLPAGCRLCRYWWRVGREVAKCPRCSRSTAERKLRPIKPPDWYLLVCRINEYMYAKSGERLKES